MKRVALCIFILTLLAISEVNGEVTGFLKDTGFHSEEDDDLNKPFQAIVTDKGYPLETHKVLTEDGYWLTVFRIPGKKGETLEEAKAAHRPAIFLQHGVLDSADTWIMHFEEKAPAFKLANEGYDVWLGNTRGNKYSREHQTLNPDYKPDRAEFFDFSFGEMAQYDVPANIKYVIEKTGKSKIAVMAHSQGTTQMLMRMASDNAWWNEHVGLFVCLAGVARLEHCTSKLLTSLAKNKFAIEGIKKIGIYEFFPSNYLQNEIFSRICKAFTFVCDMFLETISDKDPKLNDQKRFPVFMGHYPAGTSFKSLEHFAQIINAKRFQNFDYGKDGNQEHYGQDTAPEINLAGISGAKIIHIGGTADELSDQEDYMWLKEQLGNNEVYFKEYELGHMSFLLAADMSWFDDVVAEIKKHSW
jgi:gastric triacylglycerol lipase